MSDEELIVSRHGRIGRIRLNRPAALNSLTLNMVRLFTHALADFASDDEICAVLVSGEGERGLCAGGDIRLLYEARGAEHHPYKQFWREEYRLNARIAAFEKPYVVFMDGIVMGGGVGISAHGNRRLVTERTRLAMPETSIGYIPDVGGAWLLTRRPGGGGAYMALTGAAVDAADAIFVGLADMAIDSADIPELQTRLSGAGEVAELDEALARFARKPEPGSIEKNQDLLDAAMSGLRVEDVVATLSAESSDFAKAAAARILANSPTSVRLTYELLRRAARAGSLEECLNNDYRAACALLATHDLYEGVRAAIIDKDRNPRWSPASLSEVEDATIARLLEGTGDTPPFPDGDEAP
ncbi:MAG TPA: enoyl-CoA hydratase/isomerase family protein [Methylocystis sp.]|nr:enoyl-CoA hydratase/isomerase family protein [Methylocystis sp.]